MLAQFQNYWEGYWNEHQYGAKVCADAGRPGLITTEPTSITTRAGQKRNGNLLFTIRPIQEAVEQFYQQQMEKISLDVQRKKASGTKVRQERPA